MQNENVNSASMYITRYGSLINLIKTRSCCSHRNIT